MFSIRDCQSLLQIKKAIINGFNASFIKALMHNEQIWSDHGFFDVFKFLASGAIPDHRAVVIEQDNTRNEVCIRYSKHVTVFMCHLLICR